MLTGHDDVSYQSLLYLSDVIPKNVDLILLLVHKDFSDVDRLF